MNRSIKVRFVAFVASLLVTFALIDAIAVYAYASPSNTIVVASALR